MMMTQTLWRKISQNIERQIEEKQLSPGDKLPTEYELSRQFMVNRHTVRRALSYLQDKGFIESTQGRGTFVRRPARPVTLNRRPRFAEAVILQGRSPSVRSCAWISGHLSLMSPPEWDLPPGAPIVFPGAAPSRGR